MSDVVWTLLIVAVVVGVYFAPTMIAFDRNVPSPWSVAVINVLLGWTLVGWAVALAMAMRDPRPRPSRSDGAGVADEVAEQ